MDSHIVTLTEMDLLSLARQHGTDFGYMAVVAPVVGSDYALDCVAVRAEWFTSDVVGSLRHGDTFAVNEMLVRTTTECMPGTWQELPNEDLYQVAVVFRFDADGSEQARRMSVSDGLLAEVAKVERKTAIQHGHTRRRRRGGN